VAERELTSVRRLSQTLAEGDGISVIASIGDTAAARSAEEQGAEGPLLTRRIDAVREQTSLPLLWGPHGPPADAADAGADAWRLVVGATDEDQLEQLVADGAGLDLECVVEVADEDELRLALERLDPEIFLLSSRDADEDEGALERVLDLLPDVPAGKLAIADVPVQDREDIVALERAGVDGVIVATVDVVELVGKAPPEV
jgi:indole-3-glycerol phosphate synthase